MILTSTIFSDFISMVSSVAPVIVGFLVSVYAVAYLLRLISRYVNTPDPVDVYARKVSAENDAIMKNLK